MTTHPPHNCSATSYAVLRRCKAHGQCQIDVMVWSCGKKVASRHGAPCPVPKEIRP